MKYGDLGEHLILHHPFCRDFQNFWCCFRISAHRFKMIYLRMTSTLVQPSASPLTSRSYIVASEKFSWNIKLASIKDWL